MYMHMYTMYMHMYIMHYMHNIEALYALCIMHNALYALCIICII